MHLSCHLFFFKRMTAYEMRISYWSSDVCSSDLTMAGFDISKAKSTQFSQEFRLQSSFYGPINFSVGANYTKFKTVNDYYVMFNVLSAIASIAPFNAGLDRKSVV